MKKLSHSPAMDMPDSELMPLIEQLRNRSSSKRRSAALRLRKAGVLAAGPALLDALVNELKDPRTWETQYQMIMALGHSGYVDAFCFIETLAHERFLGRQMVLVAVGDTFVRLSRSSDTDAVPVLKVLSINNDGALHDGALRAAAMLKMRFNEPEIREIIHTVESSGVESRRFWPAAACAGWSGPDVDRFIERCLLSTREDVREAASAARLRKYRNWRPL